MNYKNKIKANHTAYSDNQANEYDSKRFSTPSGKMIHSMELKILRYFLKLTSIEGRILEVGCGTGRLLIELIKKNYIVDGVDASTGMLIKLQKKFKHIKSSSKFYISESAKLPFKDNDYNFVYSIRLLNQTESIEYALESIKEMVRVVEPGGYVLVEFVNNNRPQVGRNATKTVRLSHNLITDFILKHNDNVSVIKNKGVFFFGMGAIDITPVFLLNFFSKIDGVFAFLFPKYCSRGYVLIKKNI